MQNRGVLIMAKAPLAGAVKTRLCPPCTPEEAAEVAASALADTLDAALGTDRPVTLALAGPVGSWVPPGVCVIEQEGTTFSERLARAWANLPEGGVQIGMDTPQCTPAMLRAALAAVDAQGSAFGPAADGGWWLIGLDRPHDTMFDGIAMSEPTTGAEQLRRMRSLGLDPTILPTLVDIDTWTDAQTVARDAPGSRTAGTVARITESSARSR